MSSFHPFWDFFFLIHSRQYDTINHLALFAFPLFFRLFIETRLAPTPPAPLACPGVLERETGTRRSGSKICLATLAWRLMESHWANEAPDLSYRSTLQRGFTEITEVEAFWSAWHLIPRDEPLRAWRGVRGTSMVMMTVLLWHIWNICVPSRPLYRWWIWQSDKRYWISATICKYEPSVLHHRQICARKAFSTLASWGPHSSY